MYVRTERTAIEVDFWRQLRAMGRAIRLQRVFTWGLRGLALGLMADLLVLVATRVLPLIVQTNGLWIPPATGVVVALVLAGFWPLRAHLLALTIDRRAGLKERLSTALELIEQENNHPMAIRQLRDAVGHLRQVDSFEAFPLRLPRVEGVVVLAAALLVAALVVLPNPMRQFVEQRQQIAALLTQEAEHIQKIADDLRASEPEGMLSPETQQITSTLDRLTRELLRDAGSLEEAMARVAEAERRLAEMLDANVDRSYQAIRRAAASLAQNPDTQQFAANVEMGDYQAAAEELQRLARDAAGGQVDRERLTQSLRQAAEGASRSDRDLAESLGRAADALQAGSQTDAEQALREAASGVAQAGRDQRAQEQLRRALSQLQRSRQGMGGGASAQSGARGASRDERDEGGSAGSSGRGDQDDRDGRGDGDGEGTGEQGSAAGTGHLPMDPMNAGLFDELPGHPEQLGGQFGQGQVDLWLDPSVSPAQANEARAEYTQVIASFEQRAVDAMNKSYIPLDMKDLVRDYFTSLQKK